MNALGISENKQLIVCVLATIGVFVFDLLMPLGVAAAVPYLAIVLLSIGVRVRRAAYSAAVLCSVLVILGWTLSPNGGESWKVMMNRLLALLAVWSVAVLCTKIKRQATDFECQLDAIDKSQMVIEFELDGTITKANSNFLQAMGYSLEEVLGKHHSMFVQPELRESDEYRAFWQKLNRGEYVSAELKRLGKDGKEVWIQASYNPILDLNGKPCKIVKYSSDVTDRVSIGLALEATTNDLAEQTAYANSLAAEADAANQSKSEFLANMSHEIRTPMTAILGFTDILLGNVVEPENIDCARTVKENGEYLLNLINDILDLSKIEAGKIEVEQLECSPHGIIADVASLMRVRAKAKGLPLNVQFYGPILQKRESNSHRPMSQWKPWLKMCCLRPPCWKQKTHHRAVPLIVC